MSNATQYARSTALWLIPRCAATSSAGFLGNAVHDEHEATKDVESSRKNVGFFDKKLKIFR